MNHYTFHSGTQSRLKRIVPIRVGHLQLNQPPPSACLGLSSSLPLVHTSATLVAMSRYPYGLSPDITPTSTPTKLTKAQKSRARREPSGVFSLFSPPQIQQFREAFSLIDHDGDGLVGEQDLKHIFSSLGTSLSALQVNVRATHYSLNVSPPPNLPDCRIGISPSRSTFDQLLADRPGDRRGSLGGGAHSRGSSDDGGSDRGITFPMFLTMMGEHLYDFDAESELLAAFECFDEGDTGFVKCDEIRKWLGDVGERMGEHEVSYICTCLQLLMWKARMGVFNG